MNYDVLATAFLSPANSVHSQSDEEVEDLNVTLSADVTETSSANPDSPNCSLSPVTFPNLPPPVVDNSIQELGNLSFGFLKVITNSDKKNDMVN